MTWKGDHLEMLQNSKIQIFKKDKYPFSHKRHQFVLGCPGEIDVVWSDGDTSQCQLHEYDQLFLERIFSWNIPFPEGNEALLAALEKNVRQLNEMYPVAIFLVDDENSLIADFFRVKRPSKIKQHHIEKTILRNAAIF